MAKSVTAAICAAALVGLLTSGALACRPFETEDTGTAPVGHFGVEIGTEYASGAVVSKSYQLGVNVGYGVAENMQVCLFTGGIVYSKTGSDSATGMGDSSLLYKWRFYGTNESDTAAAVFTTLSLPTGDKSEDLGSGEYDGSLALAYSVKGPWDTVAYFNAGYNANVSANDTLTLAAAVDKNVTEDVRLVTEFVTDRGVNGGNDDDSSRVLVGAIIGIAENAALDLGVRIGLDNRTPDTTVVLGVTLDF